MATAKEEEMMLRQGAEDLSASQDQYLSSASPKGKFSAQKVNALLQALDKVVALFGEVAPSPRVKDSIQSFPPEVMAKLFAVIEALSQYDMEGEYEMPEPSGLATDDDLIAVMVVLDKLSKDKKFKKFLKKPVEVEVEMGGEEEGGEDRSGLSPDQESEMSIMFGE